MRKITAECWLYSIVISIHRGTSRMNRHDTPNSSCLCGLSQTRWSRYCIDRIGQSTWCYLATSPSKCGHGFGPNGKQLWHCHHVSGFGPITSCPPPWCLYPSFPGNSSHLEPKPANLHSQQCQWRLWYWLCAYLLSSRLDDHKVETSIPMVPSQEMWDQESTNRTCYSVTVATPWRRYNQWRWRMPLGCWKLWPFAWFLPYPSHFRRWCRWSISMVCCDKMEGTKSTHRNICLCIPARSQNCTDIVFKTKPRIIQKLHVCKLKECSNMHGMLYIVFWGVVLW